MEIAELIQIAGDFGFPAVITIYLLTSFRKDLKDINMNTAENNKLLGWMMEGKVKRIPEGERSKNGS